MPKCKLSNCREEAVPYGKRYCPFHLAEYNRKQREYRERAEAAPKCPDCGVAPLLHEGYIRCRACQDHRDQQERAAARQELFDGIDTLEELKDWIRVNLWKETE